MTSTPTSFIIIELKYQWLPTKLFDHSIDTLSDYDALWCAPGSPYQSMNGAINAIRYARENNCPFLGTCGGFQHAVAEYGRNVLHIPTLEDLNFNAYEPNDYITALSCSLIGQTRTITLSRDSGLQDIYGSTIITERYNCSFGLNKSFEQQLSENGFQVIGSDENGDARIMTVAEHPFYLATLFQPQLSSTYESPHPLIVHYLRTANTMKKD